ncbi:MAG TPA: ThuA domain-containing protein [Fimbriimonadaceae bacterium]|nr:ThuA domain-containing protein [Fimbriimonadaceae bacterium]
MAERTALIVWGGWDGHEPDKVARFFEDLLKAEGFTVEVQNTLDAFADAEKMAGLSLIIPVYTMSTITAEQRDPVIKAVAEHGVGIAGCHGGMCDAFRMDTEWQFMTGSQWVAHPGNDGVTYSVKIDRSNPHPITDGIPDFEVVSEQYYLHVDPGNNVLAYTEFPTAGVDGPHVQNPCKMPQVYTKMYGAGRVFYNALGHHCDILEAPQPRELMRRGFLWAAKGVGL